MKVNNSHIIAQIMQEAKPYIEKYQGKIIVVKYGGAAMSSEALKAAVMSDLSLLALIGIKVVLVHGGGPEINGQLKKMGKESKFVDGLRVTDGETMEIVQQMLAGKVNKDLVALLKGKGVGLCGMDGGMIVCRKLEGAHDLGFVGDIEKIDTTLITFALKSGFIPVIATIGADEDGIPYNINADAVACKLAIALNAVKIICMTDVPGILRDKNDENTLISDTDITEVPDLITSGIIEGSMIPKIQGCVECIEEGIEEAIIINGKIPHSILLETFSDRGSGTMLYKKEKS